VSPTDIKAAPTSALGYISNAGFVPSWGLLAGEDMEENSALVFPQSVRSYNKMLSDSQVQGLKLGSTWPIFRMRWFIKSGDADPAAVERLSMDYGLPVDDNDLPLRRTRNRFKFLDHLENALDAPFTGFKVFEQQYEYADPADGGDGLVHLRKLLNLPETSIAEVRTEDDGGIVYVRQQGFETPEIPIDRLVWYAFQKRNANWSGRSLLRGCYGPWLLKDRVLRVGAINLQRAGVGVPVIEAPPGASDPEIAAFSRMAEKFRGGERAGGALPSGAKLRLVGVEGSQPDAVGFIQLMNEEMARAFLQMFMILGQSASGSRALGETFVDWHKLTLEYIADWFTQIFNEHVIEDDWDYNYGEEVEEVPRLAWEWDDAGTTDPAAAEAAANPMAEMQRQVQNGSVQVDGEVAAMIGAEPRHSSSRRIPSRRRGGTPTRAAGTDSAGPPPIPLPGRALRRQPYKHEIAAAVDYAAMDSAYQSALDLLVMEVRQLQRYQVDELHDAIVEANGNLKKLGAIAAEPQHSNVIQDRLTQVAQLAAEQHVGEAERQGKKLDRPDTTPLGGRLANRSEAVDNIITRDISSSASRNAVRLSGGSLSSAEVADMVRADLLSRSDSYLRDVLGGAVQHAINDGRNLVMKKAGPDRIYASELLDNNTCSPCAGIDGTEYQNLDDAERDYPGGGFTECAGRDRCRGTLVAVYGEGMVDYE
jgi:hypothetical protein